MDQLSCIKAFVTIVNSGSLHKAAEKLDQTDAAISKKLSRLEDDLKLKLLERSRSGIKLTTVGEQYYMACKEALDKVEATQQFACFAAKTPKGELKVSCNRAIYEYAIASNLKSFLIKYPHILLNISLSEKTPNFIENEIDILFGVSTSVLADYPSDLVQKRVATTKNVLCCTKTYVRKHGVPKKPADLLNLQYLCHRYKQHHPIIAFDNKIELTVEPFLILNDTQALIISALQDLGYIDVKEYAVKHYLKSGELINILPNYQKKEIILYVYYRNQIYLDPKIRAFLDFFTFSLEKN